MWAGIHVLVYLSPLGEPLRLFLLVLAPIAASVLGMLAAALVVNAFKSVVKAVVAQNVLSSAPLRKEVDRIMRGAKFSVPIYVTTAEQRVLHDPDNFYEVMRWQTALAHVLKAPILGSETELYLPKTFIPNYLCLSDFEHDDLVNALMATAALPLGLVQAVEFKGSKYVDGGIVDNRPVLPLVSWRECDALVVICLRPVLGVEREAEKDQWRKLQRLIDLSTYNWDPKQYQRSMAKNDPPIRVPHRQPEHWPEIFYLAPSTELGNFLSGTLNFTEPYAKKMISLGYKDATEFLLENSNLYKCG